MTKRSFNSIVKVKDGEMILLGGIEKNLTNDSSTGLPWIARVPVLRLFFGNVTKTRAVQKLNVFIRPIMAHLQSSVFKLSKDLIDSIHEEGIVAYTS